MKATILSLLCTLALSLPAAYAKDKADDQTEQVKRVEQQWLDAYVKADTAALEKIESDDFVLNDPAGAAKTKADDIQDVKSGALKWTEARFESLKVRLYGKTAIITGVAFIKGTYSGQDVTGRYRFTDVLIRKKTEWRAVSSQVTRLAEPK
jgi:ketosteroid isomerase-like protein